MAVMGSETTLPCQAGEVCFTSVATVLVTLSNFMILAYLKYACWELLLLHHVWSELLLK